MRSPRAWTRLSIIAVASLLFALASLTQAGPAAKEWDGAVDKAINYLKSSQGADGSWSREKSPGVTGVAVTGLLSTGKISSDEVDAKLEEWGALDLCYPELARYGE